MRLETVRQTADRHSNFTVDKLRYSLKNRAENGLARAVIRVGRKMYLDADAFDAWLDSQREQAV